MPQKIDVSEIAQKNPKVNLDVLEEFRKLRESLHGSVKKRQRIIVRRRVRIDDDLSSDPRVVRFQTHR